MESLCLPSPSGEFRLEWVAGDLTEQSVDAIVNAANPALAGGGGVDGAIHRAGGPSIMRETRDRYPHGCPTGSAVITAAGDLPCRHVIHTVGPVWNGGTEGEPDLLAAAFRNSLELAAEHGCQSVAFPAISGGVYGYPLPEVARIGLTTAAHYGSHQELPRLVRFVLFDEATLAIFRDQAATIFG